VRENEEADGLRRREERLESADDQIVQHRRDRQESIQEKESEVREGERE